VVPASSALRQLVEVELLGVQPLLVRVLGGQFGLDLLVGDDAALGGVDQEHPARLQAHPLDHPGGSRSRTPTSEAITTRPSSVTQIRDGRRPLRSSTAPTTVPSEKHTEAGPSHGSISDAW
jgi:hypothetical protein